MWTNRPQYRDSAFMAAKRPFCPYLSSIISSFIPKKNLSFLWLGYDLSSLRTPCSSDVGSQPIIIARHARGDQNSSDHKANGYLTKQTSHYPFLWILKPVPLERLKQNSFFSDFCEIGPEKAYSIPADDSSNSKRKTISLLEWHRKMSTGKLIFSFGTGFNLALDRTYLADGSIMKFGMGFENLKMTSDGLTFTTVDHEVLAETTRPVVVANTKIEPSLKLKSVITAVEPIQSEVLKPNDQFFSAPTVFEIGSSSSGAPLTKTQRRKKNRRIRKIHERLSRERELAEIEFVGADGQYVLPETSSLLRGSRFHPL
ncbi:hypothetical protein KFK09_017670 [Dendrobium nobile]|uniref:Uncharacterized protein n=1 Tax=Dendrobium nobile TaxID=94219 RepID=A0A8T3ATM9_DENNO|nr:hypothetical protein KFK09_017670 [Dendrobium nobile]